MVEAAGEDRNGHTPRHRASRKQSSTVASSTWPLVSRTAYEQLARGTVPAELSNLRLRRLCMARNQLWQAMNGLAGVMHDHRPGQAGLTPEQVDLYAKVWQVARAAHGKLEKAYLAYPLELRG
jgi:hypothetical protein